MKKKLKIKEPPGFELKTSHSAVESSLIKNVNVPHYPYFLIKCWLQSGIQAQTGNEQFIFNKFYVKNLRKFHEIF